MSATPPVPHWWQLPHRPVRTLEAGRPRPGIPELVIVPGLGALGYLLPTVRACATWTRVHLLDLPGFGHGATARCPASLTDTAEAAASWLRIAAERAVLLMGHSTGAQSALRAAVDEPDRVAALCLAGPTFPPEARRWVPLAVRTARTARHEPLALIPATVPQYLRGRSRVVTLLRTAMTDEPETLLGLVRAPVLVVRGTHDAVSPAGWAQRLASGAAQGRAATIGGAHNMVFTHPDATAALLRELIAR